MAKCRECGAEIPEGEEYCENCFSKLNTVKNSESYLDSLLNSVMTEEPERREVVFRKKKKTSSVSVSPEREAVPVEENPVKEEAFVPEEVLPGPSAEELSVEESAGKEEPLPEEAPSEPFGEKPSAEEETFAPEEVLPELSEEESSVEESAGEEEESLPEEAPSGSFGEEPSAGEETFVPEEVLPEPSAEELSVEESAGEEEESLPEEVPSEIFGEELSIEEETFVPEEAAVPGTGPVHEESEKDRVTKEELPDLKNYSIFEEINEEDISRMFGGEIPEEAVKGKEMSVSPEEEPEPAFLQEEEKAEPDGFPAEEPEEKEEAEPSGTEEPGDFAGLFADGGESGMGIQNDDEIEETESAAEDGLDSLLSGLDEMQETAEDSGDMAEAGGIEPDLEKFLAGFGDEEDGLFTLDAEPEEEDGLLKGMADEAAEEALQENPDGEPEQGEKKKKEKKKKEKKEKQGRIGALYHRLFDNVKVDPSKIKPQPTKEEIEAKKKAAQEAKERAREEKEALLAEKKEQQRQEKAEKQRKAKEAKAEKKEKKLKEAKLLLQEMEHTRINRAGAAIVFIFFAMIAVVILFGTDIFSYSLSIQNAAREFERDEYTLAYDEIYGLEVKDEDIVLYDRIMTVMYVQKHLNSYYNYYEMKDYPKALHSLLKGLQRYEKYIDLAVELEIDADLDSVRNTILTEINASFSLSEQEAMAIIQSDSQLEYSTKVYDAVEKTE